MNKFCSEDDYSSINDVQDAYPAATYIIKTNGGWLVFETASDYETWLSQV